MDGIGVLGGAAERLVIAQIRSPAAGMVEGALRITGDNAISLVDQAPVCIPPWKAGRTNTLGSQCDGHVLGNRTRQSMSVVR